MPTVARLGGVAAGLVVCYLVAGPYLAARDVAAALSSGRGIESQLDIDRAVSEFFDQWAERQQLETGASLAIAMSVKPEATQRMKVALRREMANAQAGRPSVFDKLSVSVGLGMRTAGPGRTIRLKARSAAGVEVQAWVRMEQNGLLSWHASQFPGSAAAIETLLASLEDN